LSKGTKAGGVWVVTKANGNESAQNIAEPSPGISLGGIMNTSQSLKQPPWSGQAVSMWVRVLAGFFVVCGLLAGLTAAVAVNTDIFPHGKALSILSFDLLAGVYLWLVLLHALVRGRAPKTWWPWDRP